MAKKLKLPKRIAGIKIPKVIRKGPVRDFMNSQAGQLIIAQSLVAAAGVFTAAKASHTDAGEVVKHPADATKAAVSFGEDQTARLTFALKEAARAFRQAMEKGPPAGEERNSSQEQQLESGSKKKQPAQRDPSLTPH